MSWLRVIAEWTKATGDKMGLIESPLALWPIATVAALPDEANPT